jgi:hypothetical protein
MRIRNWSVLKQVTSIAGVAVFNFGFNSCAAQKFEARADSRINLVAEFSSAGNRDALPDAPMPSPPLAQTSPGQHATAVSSVGYVFPTFWQRSRSYLYDLIGPGAFIGAAVFASIDQTRSLKVGYPNDGFPFPGYNGPEKHPAHGAPPEWGQGMNGFGKRYASNFGMSLIGTTTRYGLGEILHQDITYRPCTCGGRVPRTVHAVTQSFVAHTRGGRGVLSIPAIVAPFVAAEAGVAGWYPSRFSASDSLRISSNFYIGQPIGNLIREFTGR